MDEQPIQLEFEKKGRRKGIEILTKDQIENIINERLRIKANKIQQLIDYPAKSILHFENELKGIQETLEQFRGELYKLQEACIVLERVEKHMEILEDLTNRIVKMEEEFILFKLKLLKENQNQDANTENIQKSD